MNLKYKDGSSVAEHLNVFQDLVNQLSTMELVFDDEVQALFLLSSLPDSWETMVVTLSNTAPNGKLTLNIVKERMFNEETRRKQSGASSSQASFMFLYFIKKKKKLANYYLVNQYSAYMKKHLS